MASYIGRRKFLATLLGGAAAWPLAARAQQAPRVPRIGYLSPTSFDAARQHNLDAFRIGLRELGYVEDRNIALEIRWAEERYDRLPALAADLIQLRVDVIVTGGEAAIRATQQATKTVPVVMTVVEDPVASGIIASLGRPGGNVTGMSLMSPDLIQKEVELLKVVVPTMSRVGLLWNPLSAGNKPQVQNAEIAAQILGIEFRAYEARDSREIESAFDAVVRESTGALLVLGDAILITQRKKIAELAVRNHLPTISIRKEYAMGGGLMSYGPNPADMFRRAATFVHKILKGAKPADLPVEQPTRFELVINLKTAKALGLTVPDALLARADEVIE
jgi:putative tryptophan/tyrosine transport system substrate-binding protein